MHEGILALGRAEQAGFRIDVDYIELEKQKLQDRIIQLEYGFKNTKLYRHWEHVARDGKVNIYSNVQLAHFLYKTKKIKPVKLTETGQGATDEEALQQLNMPELEMLIEIRKLKKICDTYLESFMREQVDGFVHPFFNLNLVRTFRSSSDHPNFQNIPVRNTEAMTLTRRAIIPRSGHQLFELDYSGLEVRIAACYHKDPVMLKYIKDDYDMHTDMALQIYKIDKFDKTIPAHNTLRKASKNGFVFPQFYGDYYKNCAVYLACQWGQLPQTRWQSGQGIIMPNGYLSDHLISKGIKSYAAFEEHVQKIEDHFWNTRFRIYKAWKDRWWARYQRRGYVDMYTGFRCSGLMTRNDTINYPVQGAAFHCLLWSFIEADRIMREEKWKSRLIGQIHDSMLLDVHPDELNHVADTMLRITCVDLPKAWDWICVPLGIEAEICPIDGNWTEKSKYVFNQ
jgi:DNA polymerase-1